MAEAPRDNNRVPTILATSNVDGVTPLPIYVDPTTHFVQVDDGATGSDLSDDNADRDGNRVPVMLGVSNADGETTVPIYGDPANGNLLIKST